jgi:hypothetical protein
MDEEQKFGVNVKDKLKLLLLMWIFNINSNAYP